LCYNLYVRKILFLSLILCLSLFMPVLAQTQEAYPRIALVLSGGIVTRGLSEIGVIKALEEEHIPISYVAGTSMGAVLGSLLAQGYSAEEIEKIAKSIDWMQAFVQSSEYENMLFSEKEKYGRYLTRIEFDGLKPVIPKSVISPQKPSLLFTEISIKALAINDFNKFKIPFRANATDLETGQEVTFSSGFLPQVLQASSAVPMMMAPVEINGRLLADGGIVDNLPVNLVEEFKPDIIVAVNLGMELKKKEEMNSIMAILSQNLSFSSKYRTEKNRKKADLLIEPDISRYGFADFNKIDEIISIGYQAAKAQIPQLKKLIEEKSRGKGMPQMAKALSISGEGQVIRSVSITGNTVYSLWSLYDLISSAVGIRFDSQLAEKDRLLFADKYFYDGYKLAEVSYSFQPKNGNLIFSINEGVIDLVQFSGRENISEVFLKDKIKYMNIFSSKDVAENVDLLYNTGFFERVGFTLVPHDHTYILDYTLKEKNYNSLALGMRYDTYEHLSLLADLSLNYFKSQNFKQTLSVKVGNEYDCRLISEFWPKRFGQNLLGEFTLFYNLKLQDLYNNNNLLFYTLDYQTRGAKVAAKINLEPLGQISSGFETSIVSYGKIFSIVPDENITKWFIKTSLDFLDEPLFPRSGVSAKLEYQQSILTLGNNYDFAKAKIDTAAYLPLPRSQVAFLKSKIYLGRGNLPFSELYRLGGEETLLGYGRDQLLGRHLLAARFGYRFPLASTSNGLMKGLYLSLLQDVGLVADRSSDISLDRIYTSYGAELQFETLLGLAARFNLGISQKVLVFFAIGNEF